MASIQFLSRSINGSGLPSMTTRRSIANGDIVCINTPIKAKDPSAPRFESVWIDVEDGGATLNLIGIVVKDAKTKLTGTIPATLSDFKIDPPTLLTLPVKNEMPVRVEMTWHSQ